MLCKLKELFQKHPHLFVYLIFCVLTTLVNYAVYLPLYNWLQFSASISNIIAWAVSVLFAYVTNKPFVFKSLDWTFKTVLPELTKFVGCRVGSGLVETVIIWVTVDLLSLDGNLIKLLVSILVVILNYVASKWIVFKRK